MIKKNFLGCIVAVVLMIPFSLFTSHQNEVGFLLEFGKIVRIVDEPGLHIKLPLIQTYHAFDKRVMQVDVPARELIASDQKRIVVDAYAKYKISNIKKFYENLYSHVKAKNKIASILDSSLRQLVAKVQLSDLLTSERAVVMSDVQRILLNQARQFGLEIIDVRIIRSDLPIENSESVFSRMRTDREKEAKELRAEGYQFGEKIKANGDMKVVSLKSEAKMRANVIIGQAEAKAISILAKSLQKDPAFFKFYRKMNAYKNTLGDPNKKIILSTDNAFMSDLNKKNIH